MKAFLLDVHRCAISAVEVEDDIHEYYKLLNCDCIDIVFRKVGGRYFDIVCDDEGLYREPVKVSAIDSYGKPMLVGSLLFAHHDSDGNLTSISDDDYKHLVSCTGMVWTSDELDGNPAMYECDY